MDFGLTCKANNDADTRRAINIVIEGALTAAGHRRRRLQQVRRGQRRRSVDGGGVDTVGASQVAASREGPVVAINVCGNAGAGPPYRVGRDEVQLILSLPFAARVVATRPVTARVPKLGSPVRLQSCIDSRAYQVLVINQVLIIRMLLP